MAIAHHKPNSFCDKSSWCPIKGNANKAIEFNIKITPNAMEVWFSFDFITGEIAAMALPPQIAVPQEIKCDVFRSVLSHFPKNVPIINVLNIEKMVSKKPSFPAEKAVVEFIPNPNPITEN